MDPDVVDLLQPFYVTWWAQADRKEPPADVQKLYDRIARPFGSNVSCFVLDGDGALLRSFNGFPDNQRHPIVQGWLRRRSKLGLARQNLASIPRSEMSLSDHLGI